MLILTFDLHQGHMIKVDPLIIALSQKLRILGGNRKPYEGSVDTRSALPPGLPLWVKLGS